MYLQITKQKHIEYITVTHFCDYKDGKIIVYDLSGRQTPYAPHPGETIEVYAQNGKLLVSLKGKTFADLTTKERYRKYAKEKNKPPIYRKGGENRETKDYLKWEIEQKAIIYE